VEEDLEIEEEEVALVVEVETEEAVEEEVEEAAVEEEPLQKQKLLLSLIDTKEYLLLEEKKIYW
jgi:hypothetical protein